MIFERKKYLDELVAGRGWIVGFVLDRNPRPRNTGMGTLKIKGSPYHKESPSVRINEFDLRKLFFCLCCFISLQQLVLHI